MTFGDAAPDDRAAHDATLAHGPAPSPARLGLALARQLEIGISALHEGDRDAVMACWHNARRTGHPCRVECRLRRADGVFRWHIVQAYPFRDDKGRIQCWFFTATDFEVEREARDALRTTAEQLQASKAHLELTNAELDAFSYSVSHDLRAPLRSLDGFSQALLRLYPDKLDDRGRDYLDRIRAAAVRMGQLIDDLLRLSRISRAKLSPQPVDLGAHAASILANLARAEPERKVEVAVERPLVVSADPALLDAALTNLLENAWKYTSRHPHARIEVGTRVDDGRRLYFVRDDGAGFDMRPTMWTGPCSSSAASSARTGSSPALERLLQLLDRRRLGEVGVEPRLQ